MSAPINMTPGADPDIVRSLMAVRVRARLGKLPSFDRGQIVFNFDLNKVQINPARSTSSDS